MNRTIKFRAWNGESIIHSLLIDINNDEALWLDGNLKGTEPHAWQEEGLMQFTGLTDKNGVDIYEGDILAFHVDWAEQPNKEVIFDNGFQSCVLLSGIEKEWVAKGSNHYKYWQTDEDNIYLLNQADSYDVEVIGNIHQHPELLK